MPDPEPTPPTPAPVPTPADPPPAPDPAPTDPPELGDAGRRALAAERKRADDAEKALKAKQKQLDEIAAANMTEQERAVAAARAEGATEASAAANDRILRTEIRLAAAGKLQDPGDALAHIDLSKFTVGNDGAVDVEAISSAIDALVASKPYLAGATPTPPPPGAPTGARPGSTDAPQINREALKNMSPEQIVEAKANGQLNDALGITT